MDQFSREAFAELNAYQQNGRIGPPPEAVHWLRAYVRLVGNNQPFIDDEVAVEWQGKLDRRGRRLWLLVGGERHAVALMGRHQIRVRRVPFVIALVDEAGNEMARCAVRPRVRNPGLVLRAPQTVTRGERAAVEWNGSYLARVVVQIDSPGQERRSINAGGEGRVGLEDLGLGEHRITVVGIGIHHDVDPAAIVERVAVVAVVAPPPQVVAVAERRVTLGEPWVIDYRTEEAVDVTLTFDGRELPLPLADRLTLHTGTCGRLVARFVADGPGGQKILDLAVDVIAPPVDIRIPRRVAAQFGESVAISYAVQGAQSVRIRPLDRPWNGEFDAPARGRIEIDEVTQGERVQITARGMDGAPHRHVVRIEVGAPGVMADIKDQIDLVHRFDWRSAVGGGA